MTVVTPWQCRLFWHSPGEVIHPGGFAWCRRCDVECDRRGRLPGWAWAPTGALWLLGAVLGFIAGIAAGVTLTGQGHWPFGVTLLALDLPFLYGMFWAWDRIDLWFEGQGR